MLERAARAVGFAAAVAVGAASLAAVATASVPGAVQGTYTRHFTVGDFPQSEEPAGTYTMKITPTAVVWTARGLGVSTEQAKTAGGLLLVRDKPGSLGRLCAVNGWGSYRYRVRGSSVTFSVVKDPCKVRTEVLAKTWRRKS